MKTSYFLNLCQSLVIGVKLLYDSRRMISQLGILSSVKSLVKNKFGRYFVLSSTMIDLDNLSQDMPESCLKYLRPLPERKMVLVANLKMNGNKERLTNYCECLNNIIICMSKEEQERSRGRMYNCQLYPDLVEVVIAPPHPYIATVSTLLRKDCKECNNCEDCTDCTECKDCECVNCKDCNKTPDQPCCQSQCLTFDDCDQDDSCTNPPRACRPKGTCQCNDCGLCEFCQTCYATDCADCSLCVQVAAQNVFPYLSGGLSGEISPRQVRELGGRWVIVGSSERRYLFHESDELLTHKLRCALLARMKVVYCVSDECKDESCDQLEKQLLAVIPKIGLDTGENNETGDPNQTKFVWHGKEKGHFSINGIQDWENVVIAYEPLYALKKGLVPTPEEAEFKCGFIRTLISEEINEDVGSKVRIIYGGPVDSDTASDYSNQPNIDGFFIGTTCFKLDQLIQIANAWFIKNRPQASDIKLPVFPPPDPCITEN